MNKNYVKVISDGTAANTKILVGQDGVDLMDLTMVRGLSFTMGTYDDTTVGLGTLKLEIYVDELELLVPMGAQVVLEQAEELPLNQHRSKLRKVFKGLDKLRSEIAAKDLTKEQLLELLEGLDK